MVKTQLEGLLNGNRQVLVGGQNGRIYIVSKQPTWNVSDKQYKVTDISGNRYFGEYANLDEVADFINHGPKA